MLVEVFFDWLNRCYNIVGNHLLDLKWQVLFQEVISGHELFEVVFAR